MGLFDKKYCDICGAQIKLLGNKKLEDGNCCKECASKLSPFFSERRHSTVESIKEQLEYREANKAEVDAFNVTRTIGTGTKVLIDEDQKKFIITSSSKWRDCNPDVIPFSAVTGCDTRINEYHSEDTYRDNDGKEMSYMPPRFTFDFNFEVTIHVNNPFFDDIDFRINSSTVTEKVESKPAGGPGLGKAIGDILQFGMNFMPGGPDDAGPGNQPSGGPGMNRPSGGPGMNRPAGGPGMNQQAGVPAGKAVAPSSSEITHGNEYLEYAQALADIKEIFTGIREDSRAQAAAASAPKVPVKCPNCGATSIPTASGCCEYCGSPLN